MVAKSMAKSGAASSVKDDLKAKIEMVRKRLECTVSGLFYKAGYKNLSHLPLRQRHKMIKEALGRYYQSVRRRRGRPEIPDWMKAFIDYAFRKLNESSKGVRKKRRPVRPSRAALAH